MENKTDDLSVALQQMQSNLKKVSEEHSERTWLQTGKNSLNDKLRGDKTLPELSKEIIDFLATYTGAQIGTVYVNDGNEYTLEHSYGIKGDLPFSFRLGEGLVGQAAMKKSLNVLQKIPKNYFAIESSLGKEKPDSIVILPAVFDNKTTAVIELGKFGDFSVMQLLLLDEISEPIAVSINTVVAKKNLEQLIAQLKGKEQQLSNQINAINRSNASIELDMNGMIISANENFLNIMGYNETEILGKHHSIFVEEAYAASKEYQNFWEGLKKGVYQKDEFKRTKKSGEPVWLLGSYNPILDAAGKPFKILKIATDVTLARKQVFELAQQSDEKEKRAAELDIANKELAFQNDEKEKRAAELYIANKELAFQNDEKEKRAAELSIANQELAFQNDEKEKRAAELSIANQELAFQNDEKEKRAAELSIANQELAFQNDEKEKREAELVIANKELEYQNDEKEKRAAELVIANKELEYQNNEKEKRAAELVITNQELAQQAEELAQQAEELKQTNGELEQQTQNLKQQQEELQMSNEELEQQTRSLEEKNKEVEVAKYDIEQKTKQLEVSSKYKSEFLANMSHELRTPLNSLLILSKDLSENKKKNLEPLQVESAEIIYKSGIDLLVLINEVLDLSKIEAGKMTINPEYVVLKDFSDGLIRNFKHLAEQKGLKLTCALDKNSPEAIFTDLQRLNQILKNLLSNAIKFTGEGSVSISIKKDSENSIIISVTDTGIGIPKEKQMAIFEAFQQADGTTSRKYGGTGLGLSISRELAKLLGAEIKLSSKANAGSTFSIIIPVEIQQPAEMKTTPHKATPGLPRQEINPSFINYPTIADDRKTITADDKVVLLIEDDLNFAAILSKQAAQKGFKYLSAASGEDGLALAEKFKPHAIILDMHLPGINGHGVLLELKSRSAIRHIPVHIISSDERSLDHIKDGAIEYLMKPINKQELEGAFTRIESFLSRKMKNLLIIEDNDNARKSIRVLIGNGDVQCFEAGTGKQALSVFKENPVDCIILDLGLPDMSGFELINKLGKLKGKNLPPIIIYTGKELNKEETETLERYAESIIIKGVKSEERLLDETALFLHRTISKLPESKQLIIHNLYDKESTLENKKILLVDDDSRNVFALSKVLSERGMNVVKADNGKTALAMLEAHPDIDLVLMDIMMPEMDGYEAMKRIRVQPKLRKLPVIALTAKAMKEDKQKCIDAGASDYITKPLDIDRLLSLMRVWLSK
jgi:PAS domain S-box-containing protein